MMLCIKMDLILENSILFYVCGVENNEKISNFNSVLAHDVYADDMQTSLNYSKCL